MTDKHPLTPTPPSVTDLRQLAAAAAHEIRNPLNTMAIHCELLESRLKKLSATSPPSAPADAQAHPAAVDSKDRDALLRSVSVLSGEVQRIDRLLDQFLTHAGPPEADREPVDADAWIDALVRDAQDLAQRCGVTITLERPSLGRWTVDGVTLGRAVQAVIENAVQASQPGDTVEVEVLSDQERGIIRVRDQGHGIPPDVLPNVYQVGFTSRPGHAGLGLAIAKQVVKSQHGGDLQLRTTPGEGTTITITVPLEDEV